MQKSIDNVLSVTYNVNRQNKTFCFSPLLACTRGSSRAECAGSRQQEKRKGGRMADVEKNEQQPAISAEYAEAIEEAAKLPENEQRSIAIFINGYMAATKTREAAAV